MACFLKVSCGLRVAASVGGFGSDFALHSLHATGAEAHARADHDIAHALAGLHDGSSAA